MRVVEPLPWTLGVRFRTPPSGVRRLTVVSGAPADGTTMGELGLGDDTWISLIVRRGRPVHVSGATRLEAGDDVVLLVDSASESRPDALFTAVEG